jgi:spore maturation protein CgeB
MRLLYVASAFHRAEGFGSVCNAMERLGIELTYYPIYMRLSDFRDEIKKGKLLKTDAEIAAYTHKLLYNELLMKVSDHDAVFFWKAENIDNRIIEKVSKMVPTAFYSWDDPYQIELDKTELKRGSACHITATCCKASANEYAKAGARRALWLPPGYDPEIHYDTGVEPKADVCFIATNTYCKEAYGKVQNPPFDRREIVRAIQKVTNNIELWGRGDEPLGWTHPTYGDPSFKKYYKGFIPFSDSRNAFCNSKICINSHVRRNGYSYFNERTFQIMGCKRPMLIDNNPGTIDVLGSTALTYNKVEEIPLLIEELLKSDEKRKDLAQRAYELSKGFTWDKFCETILEELNGINK